MKKKILIVSFVVLLLATAAYFLFFYNTANNESTIFEDGNSTEAVGASTVAKTLNYFTNSPTLQFRYTLSDTSKINNINVPDNISVYNLNPDFGPNGLLGVLSNLGYQKKSETEADDGTVLEAISQSGESAVGSVLDTGFFKIVFTNQNVGTTKEDASEIAKKFLSDAKLLDQEFFVSATYKDKSIGDDVTIVEFHRQADLPIYNLLGILNASDKLENLSYSNPGLNIENSNIYSASDGKNGLARANDFNTITVAVSGKSVEYLDYATTPVKSQSNIANKYYKTPQEAFAQLATDENIFALVLPEDTGETKTLTAKTLLSSKASIEDVALAYLDNLPTTPQKYRQSAYIFKGTATLSTNEKVKFVVAVPALKVSKTESLASRVLSRFSVSADDVSTSKTTEQNLKESGFDSIGDTSSLDSGQNVGIGAFRPNVESTATATTTTTTETSTKKFRCSFDNIVPLLKLKDTDGEEIVMGPIKGHPYKYSVFAARKSGAIKTSSDTLVQKIVALGEKYNPGYPPNLVEGYGVDNLSNQCKYVSGVSPMIYLYPEKTTNLSIGFADNLTAGLPIVFPGFSKNTTWNLTVKPNGKISVQNKNYDYLYYKFSGVKFSEPKTGYVVKNEGILTFIEKELSAKMGLNQKETTDLISDVESSLKDSNISGSYYQISLVDGREVDSALPQTISPKPDSWARNILYIKALTAPIEIDAPTVNPIERTGFTVVENGVFIK